MNMKNMVIVLICLTALVLAGCDNSQSSSGTGRAFIGGTDAVEFNFMEETPPSEVYDGGQQEFEVTVNLENKGEYDVAKGDIQVELSGFYPADFSSPTTSMNPEEDLERSYIDPDGVVQMGTITYVNFPGFNFVGSLAGNNKYTIRAEVCYKYGTKAQADLCVLDDLTSTEEEVCKVNEIKSIESSSAPVQVENFEEEVAGNRKVKFSFDIVHRDTGLVSKLGSGCDTELTNKNKAWVEVSTGIGSLSCSGLDGGTSTTGYTTLYSGKRKIICMQDLTGVSGNFEKKANVLLKYDYKEHKERDVLVKHVIG
jgi:predicted small secreted protein